MPGTSPMRTVQSGQASSIAVHAIPCRSAKPGFCRPRSCSVRIFHEDEGESTLQIGKVRFAHTRRTGITGKDEQTAVRLIIVGVRHISAISRQQEDKVRLNVDGQFHRGRRYRRCERFRPVVSSRVNPQRGLRKSNALRVIRAALYNPIQTIHCALKYVKESGSLRSVRIGPLTVGVPE